MGFFMGGAQGSGQKSNNGGGGGEDWGGGEAGEGVGYVSPGKKRKIP